MPRPGMTTETAQQMAAARKVKRGGAGRPAGPRMACGWCGELLTAVQMRPHFTACPRRPTVSHDTLRA